MYGVAKREELPLAGWYTMLRLLLSLTCICTFTHLVAGDDGRIKRSTGSSVFADLSEREMNDVIDYLHQQTRLNLVRFGRATLRDASIFLVESIRPNKADALRYLDDGGPLPERAARVILLRGDLNPPVIEEYRVSPIPNPSNVEIIKNPNWRDPIPFTSRSLYSAPQIPPLLKVMQEQLTPINHILLEVTQGWGYVNCTSKCLFAIHALPPQVEADHQKSLVYMTRDIEGAELHPIGLQFVLNMDSTDPQDWFVEYVWFQGQEFSNINEVKNAYAQNNLNLQTIVEPENFNTKNLRTSLNFRGDPRPSEAKRGPRSFMPDGKRFSVSDRRIKWLGWEFEFSLLTSTGVQLHDIKFLQERIIYEIAFQEVGVFYSGGNPVSSHTTYYDSFTVMGQRVSELIPGVDCPSHAEFFTFVGFENGKARNYTRGACVFEHDLGLPLRRHYKGAHDAGPDRWSQGMPNNVLVFRQVMTVNNYDYIIDFKFFQAGQIEGKVSLSGFVVNTMYMGPADNKYGHLISEGLSFGMLHHHFLNIKVDMDILGTANRFETLDIKLETIPDKINTGETLFNRYFDRNLRETELEAAYHFNFSTPKYLLMINNAEKNKFGYPRGYRILSTGMTDVLLPKTYRGYRSRAWTQYQIAVTKYKDHEKASSSVYAQAELYDPVMSFADYIEDDENIVDEDLVTWITLGTHHIPHSEDVPIVNTPGVGLGFYLLPYNYFDEDPSLASRDNIRVTLKDNDNKFHYSGVPGDDLPAEQRAPPATTSQPCPQTSGVTGRISAQWLLIAITICMFLI